MSPEWFGILLLGVLFVAIFIGFPIAFTLIAVAAIGGYAMLGPLALHLMTLQVFSVMRDPTLASVPFFLFMGFLLEQSGLMERLFRGIQLAFASIRGSLYLAVLVTATIFAAATGIVGSSVTLLGVMAAPAMTRSGYDIRLSAGAITAGGTLGILIPPSVMLIVMGPVVGVPATDLFAAAVIPGLVLALLYIIYTLVRSYLNPALGPALPLDERAESIGEGRARARLRHRAGGGRHFRHPRRHSRRHRDADRRRRGRRVCRAGDDASVPAHDVGKVPQSGVFDAAHVLHDPAARRRFELLRRRVLATGQRDA
jgi:TRAP-type mannitol/chloroaromatic compound transport system permease large subunit